MGQPDHLDLSDLDDAERAEVIDLAERMRARKRRAILQGTIDAMRALPVGDDDLMDQERAELDAARASHARGESVDLADLERELGLG